MNTEIQPIEKKTEIVLEHLEKARKIMDGLTTMSNDKVEKKEMNDAFQELEDIVVEFEEALLNYIESDY